MYFVLHRLTGMPPMPHLSWIVSLSPLIDGSTTKRTVKIKPTKKVEPSEIAPVVSCSAMYIHIIQSCPTKCAEKYLPGC